MPARSRLLAAICLSLAVVPAWPIDLMQAYELALEQDATLQAARANAEVGRENLPQARAGLLPNVSASVSRNSNRLASTAPDLLGQDVTTDYNYASRNATLILRQPLLRPQAWARLRQAGAQVDDANAVLDLELQNLVGRVSSAYFEALLAQDQLEAVLTQMRSYKSHVDAARKLFDSGAGTRTDIDDAQSRLDLSLAQELEARQHIEFTQRQLQVILNRPIESLAPLDAARFVAQPSLAGKLDDWTARAEASSPEIQALRARVRAAEEEISIARAGHLPTLDAVAQIARSGGENVLSPQTRTGNRVIGLQLNIPLYAGGSVSSVTRQSLAAKTRAEQTLEATRRDLAVRVHKEYRSVTEGALRIAALEQAWRSAEQAVLSNQRSFQGGHRTRLDVLNAETNRAGVQRDLQQARYFYLLSLLRLRSLAGEPGQESVGIINAWLVH